jgi:hypothetical protein
MPCPRSAGDYQVIPEVFASYGSETRRTTDEEVQWALRELTGAAASRAPAATKAQMPARSRTVSYGRIYYPVRPTVTRASMVGVRAGEEKNGVDLSMTLQPTALIHGRVVGPDGQPPANVSFSLSDGWVDEWLAAGRRRRVRSTQPVGGPLHALGQDRARGPCRLSRRRSQLASTWRIS